MEDRHRHRDRPVGPAVAIVVAVQDPRHGVQTGEVRRWRPDGQDRLAVGEARVARGPQELAVDDVGAPAREVAVAEVGVGRGLIGRVLVDWGFLSVLPRARHR